MSQRFAAICLFFNFACAASFIQPTHADSIYTYAVSGDLSGKLDVQALTTDGAWSSASGTITSPITAVGEYLLGGFTYTLTDRVANLNIHTGFAGLPEWTPDSPYTQSTETSFNIRGLAATFPNTFTMAGHEIISLVDSSGSMAPGLPIYTFRDTSGLLTLTAITDTATGKRVDVPEPSTLWLLILGTVGVICYQRITRRTQA